LKVRRLLQLALIVAACAFGLLPGPAPASPQGIAAPRLLSPPARAKFSSLEAFGWAGVAGADHYEFQLSADPTFNSPVPGTADSIITRNTWLTLDRTIPNGKYWWHVRAVSKSAAPSPWSVPRWFVKQWVFQPRLISPIKNHQVEFPNEPLVLRWNPVPYAAKYLVYLASDEALGSLVKGGDPIETRGVSYSPNVTLADKHTYYWAVVPVDAQGDRGTRSTVEKFIWRWRPDKYLLNPTVHNLIKTSPEHYDPQLSWHPVPGAVRYEVEINPSHEWSIGSKVCCRDPVVTTAYSPTQLLQNNRYYWRVRAINVDGNAGPWAEGKPPIDKVFDNAPPTVPGIAITDNHGAGSAGDAGFATSSPIVTWQPVPGAAAYELDVVSYQHGVCQWSEPDRPDADTWHGWHGFTSVPEWTPAADAEAANPYSVPRITATGQDTKNVTVESHQDEIVPGTYCLRIRAHSDESIQGDDIFGNYTYFPDPTHPAFTFVGYPTCSAIGPDCVQDVKDAYVAPVNGAKVPWTPLFTWKPVIGAGGYWIIVSKDKSFTTIADYAFTRIPAWAPRDRPQGQGEWHAGSAGWTYTDEETDYYWAILPADSKGHATVVDPNFVTSARFHKTSDYPRLNTPQPALRKRRNSIDRVLGPPTFSWQPVADALDYEVQVSQDPHFGTLLDDQKTDATAYTAVKTYPGNAQLYVRVRAEDGRKIGLSWSPSRVFNDVLLAPQVDAGNVASASLIPTWTWQPVQGALGYDIHVDLPDGSHNDFAGDPLAALTPTQLTGTGVFHWSVRAEFPQANGGQTAVGPYTLPSTAFARTIPPPTGAHAMVGPRSIVILWVSGKGDDHYRVQISTTPDFSQKIEDHTTNNTNFAPDLQNGGWYGHTTFYWRVAAADAAGSNGNYTPVRSFTLRLPKQ
jgi:hypothetical protein